MRLLRVFVLISLAGASSAGIEHARAQDRATCKTNPYAGGLIASGDADGFIGKGGPGAGGDASGILPLPDPSKLCATGLTAALPAPRAVAAWFAALSQTDRQRFLHEAAKVGVVGHDGHAFGADQFNDMARGFDEAMTRQSMSDADKLKLLNMMAADAGIAAANKAETP